MIYSFDDYVLDIGQRELRKAGETVAIEPRVFNLLALLIANRERMVSKDEINEKIWDGRIVSEAALSSRISAARTVIGDSGKTQHLIKTIHGQGFRFVGNLENATPDSGVNSESMPLQAPTPPRHSIAVLKFNNMSGDPEQDFFAEGICEDIITVLAKIPGLMVIARNSSFAYKDETPDIAGSARNLA